MNEKKTVLFLMNGFGIETKKSFEVYSKENMPTFEKLIANYPFKLLYASGEMIGNNRGESSNFRDGYYNFATFGNPNTKDNILRKKIASNEFVKNPIVNESIDIALKNNSRLHVIFALGNRVNKEIYDQLNTYIELAKSKGIKEVYAHLVLGYSSVRDLKIGTKCINEFKNRVIRYYPIVKIASICGNKYMHDGNHDDISNFYRMMVSGVGEIWTDYDGTLKKKYERGMTDDTVNGFLTIKDNLLHENDSILMFNYANNIGTKFFTTVLDPKKFFPTSKVPENINVRALFTITGLPDIPFAFKEELPEVYFLNKIPETKKILVMGSKERIPYITSCLNGERKQFKDNVSVWPIDITKNRFSAISQYLAAYINKDIYDLIIVDCQLYEPSVDERTIEQIKNNMKELDKCINITYTQSMEKNYRLMITSLYGISYTFKLTQTMELVDLSEKTPFLLIDKEIRKVDMVFKNTGTYLDISRLIGFSFGYLINNNLVALEVPGGSKKKGINKKILLIVPVLLLLIFVIYYFLYMNGII